MDIAHAIHALRTRNNQTQENMAEKIGVTRQAVSKWETGESIPDAAMLAHIARSYNVSLATFVEDTVLDSVLDEYKEACLEKNAEKYGREAAGRFGRQTFDASQGKVAAMSGREFLDTKVLEELVKSKLAAAVAGDGSLDEEIVALHREWLKRFWPEGAYNPEAHKALAESYVADERFRAYYDAVAPGAAVYLRDAIKRLA